MKDIQVTVGLQEFKGLNQVTVSVNPATEEDHCGNNITHMYFRSLLTQLQPTLVKTKDDK